MNVPLCSLLLCKFSLHVCSTEPIEPTVVSYGPYGGAGGAVFTDAGLLAYGPITSITFSWTSVLSG